METIVCQINLQMSTFRTTTAPSETITELEMLQKTEDHEKQMDILHII